MTWNNHKLHLVNMNVYIKFGETIFWRESRAKCGSRGGGGGGGGGGDMGLDPPWK